MQNPASVNHVNQYARYAIGAVRAERSCRYGDAAELWAKAQVSPCEAHQRKWAMHRRAYCLRGSELKWGNK